VAVKIKLKRLGKIRAPYYRIIVADARTKRDGRAIEEIGKYHPKAEPSFIEVNSERAQHWLSVGAQPTDPVRKILEITGDWQKFKGLPGAEGTLRMAAPKENRKEIFAAAVLETLGDGAASPKGRAKAKSAEATKGEATKAEPAAKQTASAKAEKPARQPKATDQTDAAKPAAKAGADAPAAAKQDDTAKHADTAKSGDTAKQADTAKSGDTAKQADTAKSGDTAKQADTAKPDDTAKPAAKAGAAAAAAAEPASEPGSGD
jgi:small subunit ribosomal protein S16